MTCFYLAVIWTATTAPAALEGHEQDPYRMLVELHFSDNPVFTEFYTGAVVRELRDQLSNYFGELAEVEVSAEGRLRERLRAATLDEIAPARVSAAGAAVAWDKAFLVRVEWESGVYRIQWRQLSLEAGFAGPLHVRHTADRHWLAKAICLAVKDDFAPVALVSLQGEEASLRFRGASFRADGKPRLAAWLQNRTLLEPLKVTRNRDGSLNRSPISHTVIALEPGGEGSRGRVVSPWKDPLKTSASVVGFQAVKFSTRQGYFGVRVLNAETGDPVTTCSVYASDERFTTENAHAFHPTAEGWVVPLIPFQHAAYVTIAQSGGSTFQFVLPITVERTTVECRVRIDELAGGKSDLARRLRYAGQDVQVLHAALDMAVREVNRLHGAKRYEEATKRSKASHDEIGPQVRAVDKVLAEMKTTARKLQFADSFFADTDQQVAELRARLDSLRNTSESLDRLVNSINVSNKANVLVALADNAAKALDFPEAIAKYDEALRELERLPKEYAGREETQKWIAKIRQTHDELKRGWDRSEDELKRTRALITETVAKARLQGIQAILPQARDAFKTLQRFDDFLGARMLVKILDDVLQEVKEMLNVVEGRGGKEDLADLQRYGRVSDEVGAFRQEIARWLESRRTKSPPGAPPGSQPATSPDAAAAAAETKSPAADAKSPAASQSSAPQPGKSSSPDGVKPRVPAPGNSPPEEEEPVKKK